MGSIHCSEDYWTVCLKSTYDRKGVWSEIEPFGEIHRYKILTMLGVTLCERYKRIRKHRYKTKRSAERALARIPEIDRQYFYVTECFDMSFG